MKNIGLYLEADPAGGGIYQYNLSMIKALESFDPDEYNIVVFYFDANWVKILPSRFQRVRVAKNFFGRLYSKIYRQFNNTPDGWRRAGCFLQAVQVINASNCDFVIYPSQDVLAYQTRKKSVAAIHDVTHRYEPHFEEYQHGEYERRELIFSAMCQYCSAILVDCKITKKHIMESYQANEGKIFILPFVPPFYLLKSQEVNVRAKYKLPERYIFYPAQFWEHKNHLKLLEALKVLREEGMDVDLVLVGSKKNNYEKCMSSIEKLGLGDRVHVLGYVSNDDMYSLYKNAVAMVFVSLVGPTNIPPIEALLIGCPLICSNTYAMPEQVGDAALLVDPKNPLDIAHKIKRVWLEDNLRHELIRKGLERSRQYGQKDFNLILKGVIDKVVVEKKDDARCG